MDTMEFSLNLLVDPKVHKVLFAEAGKDFVDFLLSLLSMPLGIIIKLISSEAMVGSIGNIYSSIETIDGTYMLSNQCKNIVLKTGTYTTLSSRDRKFYTCHSGHKYLSYTCGERCPQQYCCSGMMHETTYVDNLNFCAGGYVKGLVTYMVTDDLSITPMSAFTAISVLKKFKASKFDVLDETVVEFSIANVELDFLEASLKSKEVLTEVFLRKEWPLPAGGTTNNSCLKLLVDTKANRVLFAEAGKGFVDFLCKFLLLPVGNVIRRLTTSVPEKTMVGCIGNVHQSFTSLNENYMLPKKIKDTLLNPDISKFFTGVPLLWSSNSGSSDAKKLYSCANSSHMYYTDVSNNHCPSCQNPMMDEWKFTTSNVPNIERGYVKELIRYMITDDLSFTPLSVVSCVPVLNMCSGEHPAKFDVRVVKFGADEALKLLKACLRSKMVFSDVYHVKDEVNNTRN